MKKQPTPVQGYDTQLHTPRATEKRDAPTPATNPAAKPSAVVQKRQDGGALDEVPITDLKSSLVTDAAITGGDFP